jgi:hypothetical protein
MNIRILDVFANLSKKNIQLRFRPAQHSGKQSIADSFKAGVDIFKGPSA